VPFNTYAQIDGSRAANRRRTCPKGIDVYFENVGGAIWQAVLPLLNNFARVPVCGLIAQYNGRAAVRARTSCRPRCARFYQRA
jgi:NADPH-dependent curcumin reductase CurA